jgi:hypothetical protein
MLVIERTTSSILADWIHVRLRLFEIQAIFLHITALFTQVFAELPQATYSVISMLLLQAYHNLLCHC